jgi:hypothetical protein
MRDLETYLPDYKDKKAAVIDLLGQARYNHPHQIPGASVSGSLSYTVDERDFTAPGLSADLYVFDLSFGSASAWTRVFQERYPWLSESLPHALDQGEFTMAHRPIRAMFESVFSQGAALDYVTIGDVSVTHYTRALDTDPWTEGATDTNDIDFRFDFFVEDGGAPESGGKDAGNDDEKCTLYFTPSFDGSNSSRIPEFYSEILRLPWTDPWASESAAFSTIFDDAMTARNVTDGGGHSGSCSLALVLS